MRHEPDENQHIPNEARIDYSKNKPSSLFIRFVKTDKRDGITVTFAFLAPSIYNNSCRGGFGEAENHLVKLGMSLRPKNTNKFIYFIVIRLYILIPYGPILAQSIPIFSFEISVQNAMIYATNFLFLLLAYEI